MNGWGYIAKKKKERKRERKKEKQKRSNASLKRRELSMMS
jgi:hypothetical protein